MKKVTHREVLSNTETVDREQHEIRTTDDGREWIVTVTAKTTGAENRLTQQTRRHVQISNNDAEPEFEREETRQGSWDNANLLDSINKARIERKSTNS